MSWSAAGGSTHRGALALLVGVLASTGCTGAAPDGPAPADTSRATPGTAAPAAPYADPSAACTSRLPAGTTSSGLLEASDRVLAAVTCRVADGTGADLVVRDVTGELLARLVAALREPSRAAAPVCDASGRVLPAFALRLADGRWVHPELPSDGCHPDGSVVRALGSAAR